MTRLMWHSTVSVIGAHTHNVWKCGSCPLGAHSPDRDKRLIHGKTQFVFTDGHKRRLRPRLPLRKYFILEEKEKEWGGAYGEC